MSHLDGNAIAGELSEVFGIDLTAAVATCSGCGASGAVARVLVYELPMGTVLRCPDCDAVLMRVVHTREDVCLEMSGLRCLRWPR